MTLKNLPLLLFLPLFMISCNDDTAPRPDAPAYEYDLQGHRGARGLLPENTIPSFLKAVELGVDTIELDVVVTADNRILVSHEPWFHHHISSHPNGEPVTEEEAMALNIFEMTYEETQQYDVGRRGHVNFSDQQPMAVTKPLLSDAIRAIEEYVQEHGLEPVYYNIETKSRPEWVGRYVPEPEPYARLMYDLFTGLDILDRAILQSFDPATLIAMREIDPDVAQAMLVSEEEQTPDVMIEILGYTPEIWSPNYRLVTPQLVQEIHDRGMRLIPWTINEREEMVRLLEMGVDGIITDYPDRAP
ncbi:MAG: glycerophosphodiester phosphodiesterase family protein [Balneolaceae bacterium]